MGKHLGMFSEKANPSNNVQYILSDRPMTEEEWEENTIRIQNLQIIISVNRYLDISNCTK